MLSNTQRADEQIVLLHIAGDSGDLLHRVDQATIDTHLATHHQLALIAHIERIQQRCLAAATSAQDGQYFERPRQSGNFNRQLD